MSQNVNSVIKHMNYMDLLLELAVLAERTDFTRAKEVYNLLKTNVTTLEQMRSRIESLEKSNLKLEALEQEGVDNWIGYDEAMETYREWLNDE